MNLSIVIICKNGSPGISETLLSVKELGNEILVYDSGSCDDSIQIARDFGARVVTGTWEGYGRNRYKAAQLATNDWILMLDTDEVIDKELKASILNLDLHKENYVYNIRYKNFYGKKYIRYGEWGNDSHIRMANRKAVYSDQEIVHEKLFLQSGLIIQTLPGCILHYTAHNSIEYANKIVEYARLSAEKYKRQGRHSTFINIFFSPIFSFLQNYFFKLGFLDGWEGFSCARMTAWYTFLKYAQLRDLHQSAKIGKVFTLRKNETIKTPARLSHSDGDGTIKRRKNTPIEKLYNIKVLK
jgi:glycosyltransferase involved in cell wall biosynthesis